jgi:hypothetical protein
MNLDNKTDYEQLTGERSFTRRWREVFRRERRRHDPMLVLSMATFNFVDGWSRTFNPLKAHENGV